jgi:hypothetical protein
MVAQLLCCTPGTLLQLQLLTSMALLPHCPQDMVMCDSNNTAVVGTCTHPIVVYIYLITYVLIVSIVMLNLFTGGAHKQLSGWLAGCFSGWLAGWLLFWLAGWLAAFLAGWLAGWCWQGAAAPC